MPWSVVVVGYDSAESMQTTLRREGTQGSNIEPFIYN